MKFINYSLIFAALKLALWTTASQAYIFAEDDLDISSRDLGFDPLLDHYIRELYPREISSISTRELVEELERRVNPVKSGSPSASGSDSAISGTDITGNTAAGGIDTTGTGGNTGKTSASQKQGGNHRPPATVEQLNEALRRLKSGKGAKTEKKMEQERRLRAKIRQLKGVPFDEAAAGGVGAGNVNQPGAAAPPIPPPNLKVT